MSTSIRAAANAANAKHSSGPKTDEGKARASRNAVKHGLTSKHLVIAPDQQAEFDELHQSLREQIAPQGALESLSFNQLLHAAWNQHRFRGLEAEMMTDGLDPLLDDSLAPRLDRLYRYAAAADRAYSRALKDLRQLQTDRGHRTTISVEVEACIPVLGSVPAVTRQAHAMQRHNQRNADSEIDRMIDDIENEPLPRFAR